MIYFSVPFGDGFFIFHFQCKKARFPWLIYERIFYKEGVNFCRFNDLPVERLFFETFFEMHPSETPFPWLIYEGIKIYFSKKPKLFSFLWPTNEGVRRISHFIAVFGTSRGLSMRGDIKTKRRCFLWFWFAAPAMIQWLEELFPCDRVGGAKSLRPFIRTAGWGSHAKKAEFKRGIAPKTSNIKIY